MKVDGQAVLEGLGTGFGGRVEIMRAYREALEGSAAVHFGGNLINCMSCSNDMLFQTLASNLTRTSTDFWPNDPASHGLHLYTNAQVSLFWGEFVLPDWDMFQSSHSAGAFHAAGRAVGGCPVYVSDKPGAHDFELLRKLTLPDGTTLRALDPGRPTRDCLFHDPTREDVLLKIFNNNPASAVVGVFNAHPRMGEGEERVTEGMVSPADISGQAGDKHAVWSHAGGELRVLRHHESWPVSLPPLGFEIFTIAPIVDGLAPVGLVDYFNSGGAVRGRRRLPEGWTEIEAVAGGRFVVWCAFEPVSILEDGHPAAFKFDAGTGQLTLLLEGTGPRRLAIHLAVQ